MKNQLVYDLPMRLFHWLFASLFIAAFWIAKTVDDESATFAYHMLAGLLLGFTVLLRILWGVIGTKHSRFSSFALHPRDLISYFTTMLSSGEKRKWAGHNPASSWATLAMFGFALALGVTGYLMSSGQKETFEDVHELLANGFLIVTLMHVAGVILHSIRHRDRIAVSMISGMKNEVAQMDSIPSSRPVAAILFITLVVAFTLFLARNFDQQKQTLNFFGTMLQLGENEDDESEKNETSKSGESHGNKDDDD